MVQGCHCLNFEIFSLNDWVFQKGYLKGYYSCSGGREENKWIFKIYIFFGNIGQRRKVGFFVVLIITTTTQQHYK